MAGLQVLQRAIRAAKRADDAVGVPMPLRGSPNTKEAIDGSLLLLVNKMLGCDIPMSEYFEAVRVARAEDPDDDSVGRQNSIVIVNGLMRKKGLGQLVNVFAKRRANKGKISIFWDDLPLCLRKIREACPDPSDTWCPHLIVVGNRHYENDYQCIGFRGRTFYDNFGFSEVRDEDTDLSLYMKSVIAVYHIESPTTPTLTGYWRDATPEELPYLAKQAAEMEAKKRAKRRRQ